MKKWMVLLIACLGGIGMMTAEEYDLDSISRCLDRCTWTYAKTMPQAPHEYIVRGKCALTDEAFPYSLIEKVKLDKHLKV